jgi:hypothetical protein
MRFSLRALLLGLLLIGFTMGCGNSADVKPKDVDANTPPKAPPSTETPKAPPLPKPPTGPNNR